MRRGARRKGGKGSGVGGGRGFVAGQLRGCARTFAGADRLDSRVLSLLWTASSFFNTKQDDTQYGHLFALAPLSKVG